MYSANLPALLEITDCIPDDGRPYDPNDDIDHDEFSCDGYTTIVEERPWHAL